MQTPHADRPGRRAEIPINATDVNWAGWSLALTATIAFSVAPPIARGAISGGMDPSALLLGRMLFATLLLAITTAVRTPHLLRADRRCVLAAIGSGLINGVAMSCFFWALTYLEASMTSMILSLSPLIVLSLLALRGERMTYRHAVRMMLALIGIYLLIGPGGDVNLVGVAWAMLAICLFSLQMVIMQWYLVDYDARTVTLYVLIAMSSSVFIWWLIQGAAWQDPGLGGWLSILSLAVISTYLARLTLFGAVSRIGSGQMAMLAPVETLFTVLWSFLFLGERLTPIQWLGGMLVLSSAVLAVQRLGRARWRPRWRNRMRP